MNAGSLKYRIKIFKPLSVVSKFGGEKIEYVFKYSCRAAVRYNPTDRGESDNEIFYTNTKNLVVYDHIRVEEEDLIEFEGKMYLIISIEPHADYKKKNITITLINV